MLHPGAVEQVAQRPEAARQWYNTAKSVRAIVCGPGSSGGGGVEEQAEEGRGAPGVLTHLATGGRAVATAMAALGGRSR